MATMLVFILTDLDLSQPELDAAMRQAVEVSFNAISIDSDQSTSDTVVAVSSGLAGPVAVDEFTTALTQVCQDLAEDLVRNGEGVRHVIAVDVEEAPSFDLAREVGKAVVNGPLLKCAVAGNDPNVGRLMGAVGDFLGNHHPELPVDQVQAWIGGHQVFAHGVFTLDQTMEDQLSQVLQQAELYPGGQADADGVYHPAVNYPPHERVVSIRLKLACGDASARVFGGDLTHQYVSENADYRS